ncbi:MAG: hypothetical protein IBX55_10765 [Methyloprofundus sp.]|nr:hypothetical protein [Methyloprofundus sp.]
MVKRRDPQASNLSAAKAEPTPEQIEAFAAGVDNGNVESKEKVLDQNAPRTFKTMSVPFNEYEYKQLVKGINLSGRTKLNFVRYAMLKLSKELQDEDQN